MLLFSRTVLRAPIADTQSACLCVLRGNSVVSDTERAVPGAGGPRSGRRYRSLCSRSIHRSAPQRLLPQTDAAGSRGRGEETSERRPDDRPAPSGSLAAAEQASARAEHQYHTTCVVARAGEARAERCHVVHIVASLYISHH